MKVVCIDIDDLFSGATKSHVLTKGKVYEASPAGPMIASRNYANDSDIYYLITADNGLLKTFYRRRFIPIEEYREIKLNNILE